MTAGKNIEMFGADSCFKPIGELAQAIHNTSTADMMLFLIAIQKQNVIVEETPQLIIGFND